MHLVVVVAGSGVNRDEVGGVGEVSVQARVVAAGYLGRVVVEFSVAPLRAQNVRREGVHVRVIWAAVGLAVVLGISYAAWAVFDQTRLVRDTTSSNPHRVVLPEPGLAGPLWDLRKKRRAQYAKDACHGDALILWTDADRSMAESFSFSTAALSICNDL